MNDAPTPVCYCPPVVSLDIEITVYLVTDEGNSLEEVIQLGADELPPEVREPLELFVNSTTAGDLQRFQQKQAEVAEAYITLRDRLRDFQPRWSPGAIAAWSPETAARILDSLR